MTDASKDLHVYLRAIAQGERSSLSVLAGMVAAGSRVLDLGTGSGALGEHLRAHAGCTVDGLTINEQEAAIARPHYRRVEVGDLERPDWHLAFSGEHYDFIVCADVLEHLRQPATALNGCRELLAPGGQILISVPNAGYCGLVAELLHGDFTYRDEGLLDRTHLRFFTRRSLLQFLQAEGWSAGAIEAIERPLNESEFKLAFDDLPPAVARYLLAVPDAGTYQLVLAARPGVGPVSDVDAAGPAADALFSAQLYVGGADGYREDRKLVAAGVIGRDRQVLRFSLPAGANAPTGLRLDPADRAGFLQLHRISLVVNGQVVWQWRCDTDGLQALEAAEHHDMLLRSPWPASAAVVLLHGEDPNIILPVPLRTLQACAGAAQVALEVELGWPMSADYMALAGVVQPLEQKLERVRVESIEAQAKAWEQANAQTRAVRAEAEQLRADAEQRRVEAVREAEQTRQRLLQEQAHAEALAREQRDLAERLALLQQHNARLGDEKDLLAREKLALQINQANLGKMYEALAAHLRWIESSTVFRATRPLVRAKMKVERLLGKRPPEPLPVAKARQPVTPTVATVDVIVPVYKGLADTRQCVESVLAANCATPWRLVIVNDASPEPQVTAWLREVAQRDKRILLLENADNLGFVGTVNRGMTVSDQHDVLLLNSDTEVANDWLDRLRRAAYSDARIASVTPFSNNATICSYPRFCEPNELPPHCDTDSLDALFAATNAGQVVDVPTGVGFCMYIRRDCLDTIGLFDVKNFGKGYGEENDFCRRAADAGWRNLHALDTFVLHTGGVSFGDSKSAREREAVEKLRRLHPSYDGIVHAFVAADPARGARLAVDVARVRARGLPGVVAVLHDRSGGTVRHAGELAQHLDGRAVFFSLRPTPGSAVRLELLEPGAGFRLDFALPCQWETLLEVLRGLGIAHVHYHHLLGHRDEILQLGTQLGVRWDFTAHDFYSMCTQISLTDETDRYCGETGLGECAHCVPKAPAPGGLDVAQWRARHAQLLSAARHVLAPSRDTARRFVRMFPAADVRLAPHTDMDRLAGVPAPEVLPLPADARLKVVVLGGLSRIKGADVLEDVASLAARARAPLEFHLIGHAYRDLLKQPRAALTVHGPYLESDLPGLLAWIKPDLIWFPALWPETYSYTLSSALVAGCPIVAPDIGSFPERLSGRRWTWVKPWDTAAADWLAFFEDVRLKNFVEGVSPQPQWEVVESKADALIGAWTYDDYLRNVRPMDVAAAIAPELLTALSTGEGHGTDRQHRRLRRWTLAALVHLRAAPPLRLVARALPLRLQTRVKSWLRA
ncbi:methyltransferase domain-containing protein [Caenimonas terrae]|uniref:Methyltransferase domain-containing protein n=1 Tax=Caenimonas terrae TaxID=696074 RepID=A0ABW0NIU9_9BURK